MKLIANSLIEHGCETYRPGTELPEVDEAVRADWLYKGLAVEVAEPCDAEPPASTAEGDGEPITGHLDPEQLGTMTNAQLKKLAEDIGADTKDCKVKADYVQAIAAVEVQAPASAAEGDGDGADV